MPVPHPQYVAVQPRRGGLIHVSALAEPTRTCCGREFAGWRLVEGRRLGWRVVPRKPTCVRCKLLVFQSAPRRRTS